MEFQIVLFFAILRAVYSIPEKSCNRIKIDENWYDKEVLLSNLGRPYNLNIHKATNTLFFSYTLPETYSDVDFQLAYYNLDSKDYQTIVGIRGGCAVAIDEVNEDIYLGGSNGIYKYNMLTKLADFYTEKFVNIWALFYKRNLFYISYPDQKLHIEIDGKFKIVKDFIDIEVDHFYVGNNVIYFANKTGLYKFNNSLSFVETVNDLVAVRQIAEDNDGKIYICTNLGIFVDENNKFRKLLDMKNIYGIAFDRDNHFVLSDEKSILKLNISKSGCMDTDKEYW